ncbi:Uncharacterised protein [Bordetella pertussis]|nr:Uncharacterised protein [Bordetella pertussis]CPL12999.1 Uncharacterised protein [Bordetella pertussis]CPM77563.1 Uncharacterised protein [Bordetella pertussis]
MARTSLSAPSAMKVSVSSAIIRGSSALRTSGRFNQTTAVCGP